MKVKVGNMKLCTDKRMVHDHGSVILAGLGTLLYRSRHALQSIIRRGVATCIACCMLSSTAYALGSYTITFGPEGGTKEISTPAASGRTEYTYTYASSGVYSQNWIEDVWAWGDALEDGMMVTGWHSLIILDNGQRYAGIQRYITGYSNAFKVKVKCSRNTTGRQRSFTGDLNERDKLTIVQEAGSLSSPANDNFSSPTTIYNASGTQSGNNVDATMETSEPTPSKQGKSTGSVWYKWTAPSSGTVTFDTIGSDFDTVLGIYTGTSVSSLKEVDSDDDGGNSTTHTSKVSFQAVSGTTYRIAVYGYNGKTGNIKLNWSLTSAPATVTVYFNSNGGSSCSSRDYTIGSTYGSLPEPTKNDSSFAGWYSDSSLSTRVYASSTVSASVTTLYAKWTENTTCSVTLDRQSGSGGTTSVTATYGEAMPSISVPTRSGYTFGGYYTLTGGSGTQYYTSSGSSARTWDKTSSTTLYAKWTANRYTVTLDHQSGSGGTTGVTATYGEAMPSISVPTRSGYTFGGYYTSTGGSGTQYYTSSGASARTWDKTSSTTLYAKWTANPAPTTYNVTYDPGLYGTGARQTVTKTQGLSLTLRGETFTRTGYTQTGWSRNNDGSSRDYELNGFYDVNASLTLYPFWTVNTYAVNFSANGGTIGDMSYSSVTVVYGKNAMQAGAAGTKVTYAGYTLLGWYDTSASSGGNMIFDAKGYAVDGMYWNGSYTRNADGSTATSATWKYAGGVMAYARWTQSVSKYTVTLNANGGSVSGKSAVSFEVESGKNTCQAGAKRTVTAPSGKTLAGWYDQDGNIMFNADGYAVAGKYWNGSYVPNKSAATWRYAGNVTAYARWKDSATYTVSFYGGGKTLGSATVETGKNTNQAAASAYKPTREGYVLAGWYDKDGKIMFDAQGRAANGEYWSGSYVPSTSSAAWIHTGDVTAYARWTPSQKYTLTFYGGGKTLGTATVETGKNTNQAAASAYKPTRAGYVLSGWYDAHDKIMFDAQGRAVNGEYWNGSYVKGASSAIWKFAGNVTAYAHWTSASVKTVTLNANGGIFANGASSVSFQVEIGKNTNQAGAKRTVTHPQGCTLVGWYDQDGNKIFDAMGYAVSGKYWNGSYWPKESSATWKYAGNVTAYARWASNSNSSTSGRKVPNGVGQKGDESWFAPGDLVGAFADGEGTFALTLDAGMATAYLVTWTAGGGVTRECEATVAGGTLVLTTEAGEVYHLAWDGGNLVATRVE